MKIKDVSNGFIKSVARYYISENYITLNMVKEKFSLSNEKFVSNLLFRGVAENILDDWTTKRIIEKIVNRKQIGTYQRKLRWEQEAMNLRNEAKYGKEKQEENPVDLEAEKELLRFQIDSYDDYFFDEEGAPSKEELIQRLSKIS